MNVYGREFLIHDADAFTKRWYVENEGFDMTEDFPEVHVHEPSAPIPQNAVPPYNGFGGLADSLQIAWRSSRNPCAPTSTSR